MQSLDITFRRALKVWWSFFWRNIVLSIPLWIVVTLAMYRMMIWIRPLPTRGIPAAQAQIVHSIHTLSALWPLMMVASFVIQIYALRWALKTRWSDFRLQAVTEDKTASIQ
jgi:hypothetical protein